MGPKECSYEEWLHRAEQDAYPVTVDRTKAMKKIAAIGIEMKASNMAISLLSLLMT